MLSTRIVLPSLDSMKVDDVLLFLQEWKVYSSVTPKKDLVPARFFADPFLILDLVFLLKVDVRKGDVRERMSCYLRRFLQAKSRAPGLKLPESAFMLRFTMGILPIGLQKSLIFHIRDEVFPDFPTLVSTAEDELLDCSWPPKTFHETTDSLRQAGMKSQSSNRSRNLVEGTCFK
ncbi:hypothetical protein P9112_009574 [Eukaryota sp. TZLM1-RC]